ncbi:MAG: [FeFe] hydrogenase H-cluster radical SAM maturase HydE [Candidatus Goldbacteria bacterium]|nr:[FeFe] hydrogenase H-cluster radical SAM maturase HydE [Candidatus Goldiibacteriota bacterium]
MEELINRLKSGTYTKDDLIAALSIKTEQEFMPLFKLSEEICEQYFGKGVFIRGIIEYTNKCRKNCNYCGIRRDNEKVLRYLIKPEEIFAVVEKLKAQGVMTVVLQGGEDADSDPVLLDIIKQIREKYDMAITISIGERPFEVYKQFKEAGADRFLLRIETTNPELFKALHPDDDLEYRKKCLLWLKELGYQVGTGIMTGLPGQTMEMIADDLLYFKELQPAMVGIGPFLPHKDTPFGGEESKGVFLTLKTLALIRIMLKNVNLPATTAMGTSDKDGRKMAMMYGANVFMPNYTPAPYRESYLLYDNKICVKEDCSNLCAGSIIKSAGKHVEQGRGDYKSF